MSRDGQDAVQWGYGDAGRLRGGEGGDGGVDVLAAADGVGVGVERGEAAGFRLARFQISCCAADAVAAVVRVSDPSCTVPTTDSGPTRDSWLTVIGTFRGVGPDGIPELDAAVMQPWQPPLDPYE